MINPYCRSLGWLFDDLKRHLRDASPSVIASEDPDPDADAYICIRTSELSRSPDLPRTIVQLHSLIWDHHLDVQALREVGGIVVTHPKQLDTLQELGIALDRKAILCRPIGSLEWFTLRDSMPDTFTVGWVGRPILWRGRDIKRLSLFVEAVKLAHRQTEVRALLVGERLRNAGAELRKAGVSVELHERADTPISSYPALYHRMDALVVTAEPEPGPLSVWEALACGVPVVSTPRSWVRWSLPMVVAEPNPEALAARLVEVAGQREELFANREFLRAAQPWWLEDWCRENVVMAEHLAKRKGGA